MKKEKISPIQIGCAEIPIRTNVIETRSKSERGRRAERMPTGIAISIQTMIPPKASEAVTGAADAMIELTVVAWRNDLPRSALGRTKTGTPEILTGTGLISRQRNFPYWTYTGRSRPR